MRFILKHYPHPFKVLRVFLELWEELENAKDGGSNMELIARSRKLEKTRFDITLLEQEAWRAYCYSCIPTDFLVDHFLLRERQRGFSPSSSVFLLITCLDVIFVFASLFPTLLLLITVVFVINYGLECFANLGIAYIYHSAHQLFEYKLVLVNLNLEV